MSTPNFERLAQLPALQGFSPGEMTAFFRIASKRSFQPGEPVLRSGEAADCFFVIAVGQVEIHLGAATQHQAPLAQLGSGQLVGEMPLLYAQPLRQADVIATQASILLRFGYEDYRKLALANPTIGAKFKANLGKIITQRVWSTLPPAPGSEAKPTEPVAKGPSNAGTEALRKVPIFTGFDEEDLLAMRVNGTTLNVKQGDDVVKMGEASDSFFLVLEGYFEVAIPKEDTRMPVARLGPGQVFGEMALVYQQPARTADVVAATDGQLLRWDFVDYRRLISERPEIGRKLRNNLGRVAASRSWTLQPDSTGLGPPRA